MPRLVGEKPKPAAIIAQIRTGISVEVERALAEDMGSGDRTSALLPEHLAGSATLVCREACIVCGQPWVSETYRQLGDRVTLRWLAKEGDEVDVDTIVAHLEGPVRDILTGERTALNFMQLLSGVATRTRRHADRIKHTRARILDTRKTVPGLRAAQKYAVACGGGHNHRMGLYDALLLKENHLAAFSEITAAIHEARAQAPNLILEVEVENLTQLQEAIKAKPDIILLDNFSIPDLSAAVAETGGRVKLEASGGITEANLTAVAETGVDFISMGDLTKNVQAIDLSLRVQTIRC